MMILLCLIVSLMGSVEAAQKQYTISHTVRVCDNLNCSKIMLKDNKHQSELCTCVFFYKEQQTEPHFWLSLCTKALAKSTIVALYNAGRKKLEELSVDQYSFNKEDTLPESLSGNCMQQIQ